jgi:hypothetical protein
MLKTHEVAAHIILQTPQKLYPAIVSVLSRARRACNPSHAQLHEEPVPLR